MDTATLRDILLEEIQLYAGRGLNSESLFTHNDVEQVYAVIDFAKIHEKRIISTVLVARIVGEQIVIEVDKNNKPLVDALIGRGVPSQQIITSYQDESVLA